MQPLDTPAPSPRLIRAREIAERVMQRAERPLTTAEVRHLVKKQDPSLDSVLIACAVSDLRRRRRIPLAD
jgi:hypothetical protein